MNSCTPEIYSLYPGRIDMQDFSKEGIFITPGDINKEYETIAIVSATCYPGNDTMLIEKKKQNRRLKYDEIIDSAHVTMMYGLPYHSCSNEEMFNSIISQMKELNANGIIHFKIEPVFKKSESSRTMVEGLYIEGWAVKIK